MTRELQTGTSRAPPALLGILLFATFAGCIQAPLPSPGGEAWFEVWLSDAPAEIEELRLRVAAVYVGERRVPLRVENPEFDLLELRGADQAIPLASGRVPMGSHSELRVVFEEATAVIGGELVDVPIPRQMLLLRQPLGLEGTAARAALLDVDAGRSLVPTESGYTFRPLVQQVAFADPLAQPTSTGAPAFLPASAPVAQFLFVATPSQADASPPSADPQAPIQTVDGALADVWREASEAQQTAAGVQGAAEWTVDETVERFPGWFILFEAGTSQEAMKATVALRGGVVVYEFQSIPSLYIRATETSAELLRGADHVLSVDADHPIEYSLATTRTAVQQPRAIDRLTGFRDPSGNLLTGAGVGVAIIDTGFDGTHADLPHRLVNPSSPAFLMNYKFESSQVVDLPMTDTLSGHGTHVAGILGGRGTKDATQKGIAPGVTIYGLAVGDAKSMLWSAEALDWVAVNHALVDPPIKILSNSWGGGRLGPSPLTAIVNQIIAGGVTVVWAAGNEVSGEAGNFVTGECVIATPGNLCVGGYDDLNTGTRDGRVAAFTVTGLAGMPQTYPDLVAPGASVRSTAPPIGLFTGPAPFIPYVELSGTSMSAPHVAGAVALMLQARPGLTPAQIETILEDTAYKFTDGGAYESGTHPMKGHGLLDAYAAIQRAKQT